MSHSIRPSSGAFSQDFGLRERPELRVLFIIYAIEIIGFGMIIPVKSFFMIEELKFTAFQVGAVLSGTMAAQIVGAPLFGRFSDAVGRRPIIVIAFFWVGCWQMATSLVQNFSQMLFVRIGLGLCGGTYAISTAPVLDVEPGLQQRSMYIGLFGALTSLAFSIGPGIGSIILMVELLSRRSLFVLGGSFAIISGIIAFFFLKETLPQARRRPLCGKRESKDDGAGLTDLEMVNLGLSLTWIASFLVDFGKFFLYSVYAFLIRDLFGYDDKEYGIILMIWGISSMFIQAIVFPEAVRLVGLYSTVIFGGVVMAVGLACLPLAKDIVLHFSVLAMFGIGGSLWEPGVPVLIGTFASRWHLGAALGVNFCFSRIGSIVSPLIGGWFWDKCGSCSFFIGGAAIGLAALILMVAFFCATEVPGASEMLESKYAANDDVKDEHEREGKKAETEPLMNKSSHKV